jgi:hypothetical protein
MARQRTIKKQRTGGPFVEGLVNITDAQNGYEECEKLSNQKEREKIAYDLREELSKIERGKNAANEYERFCFNLVKRTFTNFDFVSEPIPHTREFDYNDGLTRSETDIHIDIRLNEKSDRKFEFWKELKKTPNNDDPTGFSSRKVLFECKNNNPKMKEDNKGNPRMAGALTEHYLYQVYRYLRKDKVGKFGILLCRENKTTKEANIAWSCLREDGFFVLVIDDDDITSKKDDVGKNGIKRKFDGWLKTFVEDGYVERFFAQMYSLQTQEVKSVYQDGAIPE